MEMKSILEKVFKVKLTLIDINEDFAIFNSTENTNLFCCNTSLLVDIINNSYCYDGEFNLFVHTSGATIQFQNYLNAIHFYDFKPLTESEYERELKEISFVDFLTNIYNDSIHLSENTQWYEGITDEQKLNFVFKEELLLTIKQNTYKHQLPIVKGCYSSDEVWENKTSFDGAVYLMDLDVDNKKMVICNQGDYEWPCILTLEWNNFELTIVNHQNIEDYNYKPEKEINFSQFKQLLNIP